MKISSKTKVLLFALLTMFLWGSLFPMVKLGFLAYEINTTADILLFAGVRFSVCGILISVWAFAKNKKDFALAKSSLPSILSIGLFAIVLHYSFTYLGLSVTTASKTAIIKQVGALFYVLFSPLFFKSDTITLKKVIGVILGFVGVVAINFNGDSVTFSVGDLLILGASLCTVISNVISKKVFAKVDPITATGISQTFGGAVLLIAGVVMGGKMCMHWDWSLLIMVYVCVASIISYCIWYSIVKSNDLSNLFIIKFAEPLFSCILGGIILRENIFQIQYLIAFLLICVGIIISNLKTTKKNN